MQVNFYLGSLSDPRYDCFWDTQVAAVVMEGGDPDRLVDFWNRVSLSEESHLWHCSALDRDLDDPETGAPRYVLVLAKRKEEVQCRRQ